MSPEFVSRRDFVGLATAGVATLAAGSAFAQEPRRPYPGLAGNTDTALRTVHLNEVTTFSVRGANNYADPYNEVDVDAIVTTPDGVQFSIPAFSQGRNFWSFRFAGSQLGEYSIETKCSVPTDAGLH